MIKQKRAVARIGETNVNTLGNVMTIIRYINRANIIVKFSDGYITKTCYKEFFVGAR